MKIQGYGFTTTGRRAENQDAYYWEVFDKPRGCIRALAALCDGMGGHSGGETASRIAVETIEASLHSAPRSNKMMERWLLHLVNSIKAGLARAVEQQPELADMGTTLVMGVVTNNSLWILNLGDSKAYLIDPQEAIAISHDHTAVQDAIDRGMNTLEELLHNEMAKRLGSVLTRHLGPDSDSQPDIQDFPLRSGQWLLLCSDGLTGTVFEWLVTPHEMKRQISSTPRLELAAKNMVSLAYQYGSKDNITVIGLELGEPERQAPFLPAEPDVERLIKQEQKQFQPRRRSSFWLDTGLFLAIGITLVFLAGLIYRGMEPKGYQRLMQTLPSGPAIVTPSPIPTATATVKAMESPTASPSPTAFETPTMAPIPGYTPHMIPVIKVATPTPEPVIESLPEEEPFPVPPAVQAATSAIHAITEEFSSEY